MNEAPQVLNVETLAQTRLFNIEAVDLAFSNGRKARFERLMGEGPGAVLVVPLIDAHNLLLVREYAVGLERYELGFVKGRIDGGEGPRDAAQREMQEETGFAARELVQLASVALTPAYSNYWRIYRSSNIILCCRFQICFDRFSHKIFDNKIGECYIQSTRSIN